MKKFGDIIVNFDAIMYYFYEWEDNDKIEYVKDIPLVKVSKTTFKKILQNHIKLDSKFLEKIKHQTFINQVYINGLLITDGNNSIVLEFDNKGNDIAISTLGVADELDVFEEVFKDRNEKINFVVVNKREFNSVGRKDKFISNFIKIELDDLYKSKDIKKLNYFYKELFHKENSNFEKAYQEIKGSLIKIKKEHYYLYELMLLSHKKSGLSN